MAKKKDNFEQKIVKNPGFLDANISEDAEKTKNLFSNDAVPQIPTGTSLEGNYINPNNLDPSKFKVRDRTVEQKPEMKSLDLALEKALLQAERGELPGANKGQSINWDRIQFPIPFLQTQIGNAAIDSNTPDSEIESKVAVLADQITRLRGLIARMDEGLKAGKLTETQYIEKEKEIHAHLDNTLIKINAYKQLCLLYLQQRFDAWNIVWD